MTELTKSVCPDRVWMHSRDSRSQIRMVLSEEADMRNWVWRSKQKTLPWCRSRLIGCELGASTSQTYNWEKRHKWVRVAKICFFFLWDRRKGRPRGIKLFSFSFSFSFFFFGKQKKGLFWLDKKKKEARKEAKEKKTCRKGKRKEMRRRRRRRTLIIESVEAEKSLFFEGW